MTPGIVFGLLCLGLLAVAMSRPFRKPPRTRRLSWRSALRHCVTAPFRLAWWMATRLERAVGIAVCLVLGLACIALGFLLTLTWVTALPGIFLLLAGLLILAREML